MITDEPRLSDAEVIRLNGLRQRIETNRDGLHALFDNGDWYPADMVFMAALYRSLSLLDCFTLLVEQRNAFCAGVIVRLQLDNLLRCYALHLADPKDVFECLLKGKPFNSVKSVEGKPLTDRYLHKALSTHLPWATSVYEHTSAFVHLSDVHFFAPFRSVKPDGTFEMMFGWGGPPWPESSVLEAIDGFTAITDALIGFHAAYLREKTDHVCSTGDAPST